MAETTDTTTIDTNEEVVESPQETTNTEAVKSPRKASKKRSLEDSSSTIPAKQRRPDEISIKFLVPNVVCGALLSKRTSALRRIKMQCGKQCDINLSEKDKFYPGSDRERIVSLKGPEQLIHRACCLLHDQVIDDPYLHNDSASNETDLGPRQGHLKIVVSDRGASKIIGSKGSVIKAISGDFNIVITITPHHDMKVKNERLVTILGPSRNIFDALQHVLHQVALQPDQLEPGFEHYESTVEEAISREAEEETASCEKDGEEKEDDKKEAEDAEKGESEGVDEKAQKDNEKGKAGDKSSDRKPVRSDGRWSWQMGQNNRFSWVYVSNKRNQSKYNDRGNNYYDHPNQSRPYNRGRW